MADDIFEIKRGDLRPLFVVVLKDNIDTIASIVDLTAANSVSFNMRGAGDQGFSDLFADSNPAGTTLVINRGDGTITDRAGGECTYVWEVDDTASYGDFYMEAEIGWNDGKPETFPSGSTGGLYWKVTIAPDIA